MAGVWGEETIERGGDATGRPGDAILWLLVGDVVAARFREDHAAALGIGASITGPALRSALPCATSRREIQSGSASDGT